MGKFVDMPNEWNTVAKAYVPTALKQKFWFWCANAKNPLCQKIRRSPDVILMEKLAKESIDDFNKSYGKDNVTNLVKPGPADGTGKGKGKGGKGGKGKAKGKSQDAPLTIDPRAIDDYHMPYLDAFKNIDGTTAPHVRQEDDHADAEGVTFGNPKSGHLQKILKQDGATSAKPRAYCIFGRIEDMRVSDKKDIIQTYYHAVQIEVPMARYKGGKIEVKQAVLINVGTTYITYKEVIAMVKQPIQPHTVMSVRIHSSQVDRKVFDNLKTQSNFITFIELTFDKTWLAATKPYGSHTREITINGEEEEIFVGLIYVHNDKVQQVLKRSGHKGVTTFYKAYDETTKLIPLPKKLLMKQALDESKRIGDISMGIVYMAKGDNNIWAIRILKDDQVEKDAKALLNPDLAEAVGSLMKTPISQGKLYEVRNLDSAWDFKQIVNTLAETGWKVRPESLLSQSVGLPIMS